jgi:ribosomal-protein-alanine N-acetyltransferase
MTLRTATPDDLDAIMALERASFPTDAWSDAMMREELASRHGRYLVLEEAGRLIGYGGIRAVQGGTDADIQTIALVAGARGRGRGRGLLRSLLTEAGERRVLEVFLEVRADNPVAQALYVSEGFVEIARRPNYYQPDGIDAIVMRLDLRGWLAERSRVDAVDPASEIRSGSASEAPDAPTLAGSPTLDRVPGAASEAGACT